MAPTISLANERKTKCRKSQRRSQHMSASLVSVISYSGRTTSRRCWNRRPSRLPVMGKLSDRENRRELVDGDFDEDAHNGAQTTEPQRRESTSSMSESDTSSGCSSAGHSLDFSRTQFCRCDSLNMSDYDDDGFKDDTSDLSYPSRMEMWPVVSSTCDGNGTKGLLDIAIKTIKLIQRNQLLQAKLAQLQIETHAFIASVMANPENHDATQSISDCESSIASPASPLVDET